MNILKRDPMRDVNSDLAAILVVASCLVCLVEQSQWQLRRQYNRSCANLEKKNFRRKYTKSIFRELFAPIIRDAVDKAMAKYQSTPVVTQPAVKEIFNVDEAASFLGLSKSRIYKMTHHKEVPYYTTGKRVYFKREDLLDYVTKHRISSKEEIEQQAINYITRNRRKYWCSILKQKIVNFTKWIVITKAVLFKYRIY